MSALDGNKLSPILQDGVSFSSVEPDIYSVLPNDETGNEYDSRFGFIYDLVACNPIYNRLIWGYSVKIFRQMASDALQSASGGYMLDIGCGSLAFTANIYSQCMDRIIVLTDQSLKMLRMAKTRLIKRNGRMPDSIVLLHADALDLPFKQKAFAAVISENLLHCLEEPGPLLEQSKKIVDKTGKIFFTTLVKNNRWADNYLQKLADSGKLIPRTVADYKEIFRQVGLTGEFETIGNILLIKCEK